MLQQAIDHYHSLLEPDLASRTQAQIDEYLRAHDLFFGTRPLTTVLRPRLITPEQYALIQQGCSLIGAASRTLAAAMRDDAALRRRIRLTPLEERLVAMDPGYEEPSAHSRMDTFLTVDGASFQFVEYNAESPAAIAFQDELAAMFLATDALAAFRQRYRVAELPGKPHMLETLRRTWREFSGAGAEPSVAIVDWANLPTKTEFTLFQRYFVANGIPAQICTPDDFEYRDGTLYLVNRVKRIAPIPINLIYKRVLTSELLEHYGEGFLEHPIARAYADGKVCLINSFRAKLLHKKMLFGLLSDEALWPMFSAAQQQAIRSAIPWTRAVESGETTYQGERVDLLPLITANRERFLLKPNDEYGGKGIRIGWECSDAEWAEGLKEAEQTPFVVQERVRIAYESYPSLVDGRVQLIERLVDSDPFLFGNETHGALCRLSTATLLNVTAGGGSTVPVFVVQEHTHDQT
jgi:uncharacterized circularly permuted ATP-grasp superfamily protein